MKYQPRTVPASLARGLAAWLSKELRNIANALAAPEVEVMRFPPLAVEPSKRSEGMLAFANGTDWNPGSGAGLYEYRGGAWQKL